MDKRGERVHDWLAKQKGYFAGRGRLANFRFSIKSPRRPPFHSIKRRPFVPPPIGISSPIVPRLRLALPSFQDEKKNHPRDGNKTSLTSILSICSTSDAFSADTASSSACFCSRDSVSCASLPSSSLALALDFETAPPSPPCCWVSESSLEADAKAEEDLSDSSSSSLVLSSER